MKRKYKFMRYVLIFLMLPVLIYAQKSEAIIEKFNGNVKYGVKDKLKSVRIGTKVRLSDLLFIDKNAYAELKFDNKIIPVLPIEDKLENILKPYIESTSLLSSFINYFREMIQITSSEKNLKVYHLTGGVKGYGNSDENPKFLFQDFSVISRGRHNIFWDGPTNSSVFIKNLNNDRVIDSIINIKYHFINYDFSKIDSGTTSVSICIESKNGNSDCKTLKVNEISDNQSIDIEYIMNSSTNNDVQYVSELLYQKQNIEALTFLIRKIKDPTSDSIYHRMFDFYLAKYMSVEKLNLYKITIIKEIKAINKLEEVSSKSELNIGLNSVSDIEYSNGSIYCLSDNKLYRATDNVVDEVKTEKVMGFGSNAQLRSLSIVDGDFKVIDSKSNFLQTKGISFSIEKKNENEYYNFLEYDGSSYYSCLTNEKKQDDTRYYSWSNKVVVLNSDGSVADFGIFLSGIPKGIALDGENLFYLSQISQSKEQYVLKVYNKISKQLIKTLKIKGTGLIGLAIKDKRTIMIYSNNTGKINEYEI